VLTAPTEKSMAIHASLIGVEVTLVLSCLNEERGVRACIEAAEGTFASSGINGSILVVDNGSSDRSAEVALAAGVRVLRQVEPGYGAALRSGLEAAKTEYVVMADADGTYQIDAIPMLLQPLVDDEADIVIGSRLDDASKASMPWHRRFGAQVITKLVNRAAGGNAKIRDSQSGFRCFRRSQVVDLGLTATGIELATEMLIRASWSRLRIMEVPTTYGPPASRARLDVFFDGFRRLRQVLLLAPDAFASLTGLAMIAASLFIWSLVCFATQGDGIIGSFSWIGVLVATVLGVLGPMTLCTGLVVRYRAESLGLRHSLPKRALNALIRSFFWVGLGLLAFSAATVTLLAINLHAHFDVNLAVSRVLDSMATCTAVVGTILAFSPLVSPLILQTPVRQLPLAAEVGDEEGDVVEPREHDAASSDGDNRPSTRERVLAGVLAPILAICCFPVTNLIAKNQAGSLADSWHTGLAMAFVDHLQWGPQINFTYGPLGFLVDPALFYQSTALMASLFMLTMYSAFLFTLFQVLRREVSVILALVLTYLVGLTIIPLIPPETVLFGLCFLLAIWTSRSVSNRSQMLGCVYLGIAGAVGGLVVPSVGLEAALLIAVLVLTGHDRLKRLVLSASTFAAVFLVLWLLSGGPASGLSEYLSNGLSLVNGYSAAMSIAATNLRTLEASLPILLVAFTAVMVLATVRQRDRQLLCAVLASGVFLVFIIHEGFTRADGAHQLRFFALAVLVPIVFISADRFRLLTLSFLAMVFAVTWIVAGISFTALFPANRIHAAVAQFYDAIDPGVASNMIARGQIGLRAYYGVPISMLRRIDANSTAIEPWPGDTNLAWAYELKRWDPEPILQQYSAYTTKLDDVDANFFASTRAPRYVLQGVPAAIDSRDPAWEPPTTELSILCHYRQVTDSAQWELLVHIANRCGAPKLLEKQEVQRGSYLRTPSAPHGDIVVATFAGFGSSTRFRLAALVLFPPSVFVNIQENGYLVATRFLTGTQGDFHVVSVPISAGYSAPFAPEAISAIQFDGLYSADGSATVSYFAVPLHGAANPLPTSSPVMGHG
jgi:glycosyltransferase involved in cell wall biosynthesis